MADPTIPPPPPGFTLDAPSAAPASTPAFGGRPVIQEGPPQREPKTTYRTLTPDEIKAHGLPPGTYQMSSEGQISKIADAAPNADNLSKQQAMEATRTMLKGIQQARGYINDAQSPVGNTATGLGYNLLHNSPIPTDASQLDATLTGVVKGNIFQQWMNSMKAAVAEQGGSAFGGRILQSEIPFIVNSRGVLEPGKLHTPELLSNLDQLQNSVIRSAALLNNENPDDPKVMAKYRQMLVPPTANANSNGPGGPSGGNGAPPNDPNGGDPVKAELTRRIQSGESPADTIHWLISINRPPDKATIAAIIANQGNQNPDVRNGVGHDLGVGIGGIAQGIGDAANLVSSPVIAGVNAAFGTHYNPDMGANLRSMIGTPDPQTGPENMAYAVDRYGTAALGIANAARAAAEYVPGAIGSAIKALGNQPLTDAASGATGGAAAEGTRQMGGGPVAQTVAGVVGGLPGAMIGTRASALMQGSRELPAVVNAGQQEGVTVRRAMADPSLTPKVIATGKTMAGAKVMGRDMAATGNQIQGRVQALKDGGTSLEPYNLGDTAQGIGKRYIKTSGKEFDQKYSALRTASGGVQIPAQQSLSDVDAILARLQKTPAANAKEITYLQGIGSDLANGLDVESARDIGSKLSSAISKGDVTFGKSEKDVLNIRQSISADIANGLAAVGKPGVARAFQQVDKAYSDRMDFIHNTIQKLTGRRNAPLPPETAAARIAAWSKTGGDSTSLGRIMAQATPEERANVGATVLDSLGSSTADIARNLAKIPDRARIILFGQDGAKSLQNIQQLATEHARVMRSLGGSPTALARDARSWILGLVFGGGGSLLEGGGLTHSAIAAAGTSAAIGGVKTAADVLSARALMSPKITGWLRSAPRSADPAAINAWVDRLKVIAVREPALAPEVQRIQDAMAKAANSNVTPAVAASGTDQSN